MKEYRQNSHSFSLAFWALLCTATAFVLFVHSPKIVNRVLRSEEILGGVALLIFGPAALALYLIRARRIWVSVDFGRGILVRGRHLLPWEDIQRVERRRPSLRQTSGPAQAPDFDPGRATEWGGGCVDAGCWMGISEFFLAGVILVAAFFFIWLIVFVLIPLLIIPVLEVFAPFGDRIQVVTRRGKLVLHDLSDADEFVRLVSERRPPILDS
jgi:hypothetical protein